MVEALLYAVLLGVVLGAIYDFFRLLRLVFNDKFVLDFLFWILCAVFCYCYLLVFNSGTIRFGYFLTISLGFLAYIFTIGKITAKVEINISKRIKITLKKLINRLKTFKKVLQFPRNVYYNITRLRKVVNKNTESVVQMTKAKSKNDNLKAVFSNKKKLYFLATVLVLVCVFVFLGYTLIKNTSDINRLEIQKQEINAQYEAEQEDNEELEEILDNEDKDSYIEQKAREKGYAKSDEIVFYDISSSE